MTCGLKMVFVIRPGHAVSLFWRFFFKMPEVFLVHNFHKPAKTSIIVPKPYSFLADSDATFDIGGRVECGLKMVFVSWPGHAVSPFWRVFSKSQRSSMSTTPTSLPKPVLSYQNLIIFEWIQTQRLTLVGIEMWTENGARESARPRCQRSSMSTTSTSLPKPALSYQNLLVF